MNFKDLERSNSWNPLEYPYDLYKRGEKDKALDLIERYNKYLNWDIDIRSRMAGAKADKPIENWMDNIHKH